MLFIEKLDGIDPSIQASALVGHYMQCFAAMEIILDDLIEFFLKLDTRQIYIISANISFANKIKILRTLNQERGVSSSIKKQADTLIKKAGLQAEERNIIAHTLFGADKNDNDEFIVCYLRTKAVSKLNITPIEWTLNDFKKRYEELESIHHNLVKLIASVKNEHSPFSLDTTEA